MNEKPLVSVIMPCYNAKSYVAQSIESVLKQTYSHWELIVVDDASTDNSFEILQTYANRDSRIIIERRFENAGIAATRNVALKKAKGRFITFLDDDDVWHSQKLELQLTFMLKHEIGFSYTAYQLMDNSGKILNKTIATAGNLTYHDYLKNTIIGCGTVMLDTEKVGQVCMPDNRTSDDMALWLAILRKGFKAYALDKVLMTYRLRGDSASANKWRAAQDVWKVYRQHEKLSFFQSAYNFSAYAFHSIKKRL